MSDKKYAVLIKFSHGLGDHVQLSVLLKHLAKHRPNWQVDVECGRGKHTALTGLCRKVYVEGAEEPQGPYDSILELGWWENYNRYPDRPNSKITNCLAEVFGIEYDPELAQYHVNVSDEVKEKARAWLEATGAQVGDDGKFEVFCLHYQGNTSPDRKNMNVHQAAALVAFAKDLNLTPVILDWDRRSPIPDGETVFNPGVSGPDGPPDLWGNFGSGDAETIAALISQCRLYIGVDSGPGKIASATDTPTLIFWKALHPMQFHDPAPNTVHLIPDTWEEMPPCEHPDCRDYFKSAYKFITYATQPNREHTAVEQAMAWMQKTLGVQLPPDRIDLTYRWSFWMPRFHDLFCFFTIIEDVLLNDGYKTKLRPRKTGVEYVVDVGACVGAFARLWHKRNPEAKIACVEVNPRLAAALRLNVESVGAQVFHRGCHYTDGQPMRLLDSLTKKSVNVGDSRLIDWQGLQRGFPAWYNLGDVVQTITLEEVCKLAGFPRIDVLKMDCEGSEVNILAHCDLSRIGTIFVETHDADAWRKLLDHRFREWDVGHMHKSEDGRFEICHLVNPKYRADSFPSIPEKKESVETREAAPSS